MYDLIIIGSCPPPIGGVSVHVMRLVNSLEKTTLHFNFIDLNKDSLIKVFISVFKAKQLHLHTSNVYFRFIFILFTFFLKKKLIVTYHGNLNRYGAIKNFLDRFGLRLAYLPIVINKNSYKIAKELNTRSTFISAFIPPQSIVDLDYNSLERIAVLKKNCSLLFATNAFNVSYDNRKREIYQISDLVNLFNKFQDKGLIFSDPSSNYSKLLKDKGIDLGANILILPFVHDFNAVLKEVDCMIRYTTTDGDSLSIKECLSLGKQVIATNVVSRPRQVILVDNNINDLENVLLDFSKRKDIVFKENGFEELYKIYKLNMIK